MKKLTQFILPITMTALLGLNVLLFRSSSTYPIQEKVQSRVFEVLNGEGAVAARISANDFGGTIELFRTDKKGGEFPTIWAGSMLPGGAEIILTDPGGSGSSVHLSVNGEPASASISGTFDKTTPSFRIGARNDEYPGIRIWSTDGKTVRFEK